MALLVVLAAIRTAEYFLVRFLRRDVFTGDLAQHVWWTARFADPSLFPHDYMADFFSHPRVAPYGYQLIYRLLVPFVEPQVLAETIPFVLAAVLISLAFALGRRASGSFLGGVVGVILALFWEPLLFAVQSGLERAFALPLMMLGTLAVLTRRHGWLGAAMLMGALVYPTVVPTLAVFAVIVFAWRWRTERHAPEQLVRLLILAGAAAVVVLAVYGQPFGPDIGPRVTAAEARHMPEFLAAGRSRMFYDDPVMYYFIGGSAGIGFGPIGFVIVALLMLATVLAFPGLIRVEVWALAATSFLLYAAAHVLLFALYFPNRYTRYSLPIVVLLWLAAVVPRIFDPRAGWAAAVRARRWLEARPWPALAAAALFVVGYAFVATARVSAMLHEPLDVSREAAFRFLATLPTDTLIATHPDDANGVPLRTRRSVLASTETSLPSFSGYYHRVAARIAAELAATYAVSFDDVDALHTRYGADVFLVNRVRYEPGEAVYYPPFDADVRRRFERGRTEGFVLLDPPADRVLFRDGNYTIVRLGPAK